MKKIIQIIIIVIIASGSFYIWHYYKQQKWQKYYQNYPKSFIVVEIKNGTEIDDLAFKMTKIMRYNGYDVIDFGNAPSDKYEETVIINRKKNNKKEMKILMHFLNVDDYITLYSNRAKKEGLDATIILGKEMKNKKIFTDKKYLGGLLINGNN